MLYPIEYNLMSRSVFEASHDVLWSPCYGNSARDVNGGLIDVENIPYTIHSQNSAFDMEDQRYLSRPGAVAAQNSMKLGNDELVLLEREVGFTGVALFLKASERRKRYARDRLIHPASVRFRSMSTTTLGEGDFVGMSEKAFYLIRELQFVYACSTKSHPLSVIIHAGHPIVACALGEVLRAIPMFQALIIQTVLGCLSSDVHQYTSSQHTECQWQGDETDDEGVAGLAAGVVHILIVANTYLTRNRSQRPLAPTPLVIRFDGSVADSSIDGGGGRCRVIVFRQRRLVYSEARTPNEPDKAREPGVVSITHGEQKVTTNNVIDLTDGDHDTKRDSNEQESDGMENIYPLISKGAINNPKRRRLFAAHNHSRNWGMGQMRSARAKGEFYERRRNSELEMTSPFACKPAVALLGPYLNSDNTGYQYSVVLYNDIPSHNVPSSTAEARRCGIEDFVFVFSRKLGEDESLVSLRDTFYGTGSTISVSGYAKLFYQGPIKLSDDQIKLGREYVAVLFPFLTRLVHKSHFVWEAEQMAVTTQNKLGSGRRYCRMYLILPSRPTGSLSTPKEPKGRKSDGDLAHGNEEQRRRKPNSIGNEMVRKYFEPEDQGILNDESDVEHPREIDWENVLTVVELQNIETRAFEGRKPETRSSDHFRKLEGALLYSSISSEFFVLSGKLQHNISPLCEITRSRKFALREDGTVWPHDDLRHLVNVHADKKTIVKHAEAAKKNSSPGSHTHELVDLTNDTVDQEPEVSLSGLLKKDTRILPLHFGNSADNGSLTPVKWCMKRNLFVIEEQEKTRKRRRKNSGSSHLKKFDVERNISKKRKFWTGDVRYTLETYMKRYYPQRLKYLTQPLLMGVAPRARTLMDLCDLVQGVSHLQLCHRVVAESGEMRFLIPELCRRHPTSAGSLFIPPVALLLEHHLAMCELRDMLFKKTGMRCDLGLLIRSVTSTSVSQIANYERLEFLGDALLKLSSTVRVFTRFPHDSEGKMHKKRRDLVCNARLFEVGRAIGLQNYCRNRREEVSDWKPPGTDMGGRCQMISVKGLADVVEALCGAFFLHGASSLSEETLQLQAVDLEKRENPSNWVIDLCNDSDDENDSAEEKELQGNESLPNEAKEEPLLVSQETEHKNEESNICHPFSAISVEQGYICGYKLLEAFSVFDDVEPSHSEMLLAAAHAMHMKGSPAPIEISPAAFPYDERIATPSKPWEEHFGIIEKNIGYIFKRRPLLVCAMTHSSYHQNKPYADLETFERLEFLGDAIADFFVVRYLYEMYPELDPGKLTDLKSNVVSNEAFARTSITLGLHNFLYISSGKMARDVQQFAATVNQDLTQEDELGGHGTFKRNLGELAAPKILGDVFESIVGAVYVDSGLRHAWRVCMNLLRDSLRINADPSRDDLHPVNELHDLVMREWKLGSMPRYEATKSRGRKGRFSIVSVYVLGEKISIGKGSRWKRAKLQAAVNALERLRADEDDPNSPSSRLRARLKQRGLHYRLIASRGGEC
eukprot:gb/GEZJ01003184.1/.p1 GENE.gb/GEZJ01003184.1/~~gb/GEZJ01003184.1/.p1  ORF type:complete len:1500 (+),score=217.25 gb/GEZJ01003184.1/:3-4502(+)